MEIHKPKAAHSIREFLIEIGTIICGILIALGLEQGIEALHWRERVTQAQEAMHHETADDNAPQAYARAAVSSCLEHRLDALQFAIQARQQESRIASLANDYHPFAVTWDDGSWKAATATGVLAHFDRPTYDRWSGVFIPLPWFERDQATEHDLVDILRNGLHRDAPIADDQADRAIRAVQGLRRANGDNTRRAQYFLMRASALHAQPKDVAAILADLRKAYGPCVVAPQPPQQPSLPIDLY